MKKCFKMMQRLIVKGRQDFGLFKARSLSYKTLS